MADLMTKPRAWLRTLSDEDLQALIDRVPDEGPADGCRDNYGWQQTIDGTDYRIPVGWANFELRVRRQIDEWTRRRPQCRVIDVHGLMFDADEIVLVEPNFTEPSPTDKAITDVARAIYNIVLDGGSDHLDAAHIDRIEDTLGALVRLLQPPTPRSGGGRGPDTKDTL